MLPKSYLDNFKLRHKAIGNERRLNMVKLILDKAPNFPLSVELKDIDAEFERWLTEDIDISFDGKRLPTFKLFSNQRIGEYEQNWSHLDEHGNPLMNFKLFTRDNNPKHGENQGNWYNIPGNRDYPMFAVPVLQENGQNAYDIYSMKQPYALNLEYSVTLITNKYELINKMNMLMNDKFKAIDCYIAPNMHYMPMTLEDVSDESEYAIDDRKYYSQTYKIKVKAYLIQETDYKVTRVESRVKLRMLGTSEKLKSKQKKPEISIEDDDYDNTFACKEEEKSPYHYRKVTINVNFPLCSHSAEFTIDEDVVIDSADLTNNIYVFVLWINGEKVDLEEDDLYFYNGDKIRVIVEKEDDSKETSILKLVGYNPNAIVDDRESIESPLDENIEENIEANK